jgi:Ca-activated chloride channel family protein
MVPAAVTIKRSKTASIILLAVATIVAAIWLVPRGAPRAPRTGLAIGNQPLDPCAVAVSSRLTSTHVLVGDREEHLVVTLTAPSCGDRVARPPMTIAVVIDRSGSMKGQAIVDATRAANRLVDLLEPTDAFSIISYSTGAEVVTPMALATADAKRAAHDAIDRIYAMGGTNISAGLELGHAQVADSPVHDGVRRVVLISDGDANEGVYDRAGLARIAATTAAGGTSITAVGVGLQYKEQTMTDIAAAGRGNYYFVENASQLAEMFTAELGSAGKTVAADAELAVIAADGIQVLEVYGYGARNDAGTWVIPVADLAAGETRKIVARVRVRVTSRGPIELATARLTYRPIGERQSRAVVATAIAEVTGDVQVVRAGIDTSTVQLVEEAQTAQAIDEATMVYQREGYEGARRVLDGRMQQVQAVASEYADPGIADKSMKAAEAVKRDFAAAPTARGDGGSKASKGASKAAFDLAK